MRRKPAHLDMLPLLDVIMVIVFVFATIQEKELESTRDDHARATAAMDQKAASLAERLKDAERRADEGEVFQQVAERLERLLKAARVVSEQREKERARLKEELQAAKQAANKKLAKNLHRYQMESVLEALLKRSSVVEVELGPGPTEGADIGSRCCYRKDPRAQKWSACGIMPADGARVAEWLRGAAAGMMSTLAETKGGNALVIIRQGEGAIWRSGEKLQQLFRSREPDRRGFVEVLPLPLAKGCNGGGG